MHELLDWAERNARKSDPETSRAAAVEIAGKLTQLHELFLAKLAELGTATANEVAVAIAGNSIGRINTIRRRASDLVGRRIRVVGSRPCNVTGKQASVYELID